MNEIAGCIAEHTERRYSCHVTPSTPGAAFLRFRRLYRGYADNEPI
jgi:hypothetical protein